MDGGAWRTTVHRVTQSWIQLKQVSMQARTWHYDLIRMLPRHLDFKSSPGDLNV